MHRVRKAVMILMVLVWVPATAHCLLVALSGVEALACCPHDESYPAPEPEDGCETDGCSVVESGFYKTETVALAVPRLAMDSVLFEMPDPHGPITAFNASPERRDLPVLLSVSSQFHVRAALPPRAPTLRS